MTKSGRLTGRIAVAIACASVGMGIFAVQAPAQVTGKVSARGSVEGLESLVRRTNPPLDVLGEPFVGTGEGDVTAGVTAVNLLGGPGSSPSGCSAADFAGFPPGSIALIQRGVCEFRVKVENAVAAGASAVIIMLSGGEPEFFRGALLGTVSVPVVGVSFSSGETLRNGVTNGPTGTTARVLVRSVAGTFSAANDCTASLSTRPLYISNVTANVTFRKTVVNSSECRDEPSVSQSPPTSSGFDFHFGVADGVLQDGSPARAAWSFVDGGASANDFVILLFRRTSPPRVFFSMQESAAPQPFNSSPGGVWTFASP